MERIERSAGPKSTPAGSCDIESIYVDNAAPLHRWLTARVRDPEAAEEITQETFVQLMREVQAGRRPDNPAAWVYRVAANMATSRGRRITVAQRHAARLVPPAAEVEPEASAVRDEERRQIRDALTVLSAPDRRAVLLAATGHSGPEIARDLGRSHGATRTLLFRARARLRLELVSSGFESA